MTKDSYGYPTKIPTKITDLYGGDNIPSIDDIPTSDDIVEEIEEYLDVDLATEGQVLTMGADGIVEWDDVASGGGLPDYSTTEEKNTNRKWIDGKTIYCKTFTREHTNNNEMVIANVASNNIDKLISFEGFHYAILESNVPHYAPIGYNDSTKYSTILVDNTDVYMKVGDGYKGGFWGVYVTLYYTKNEV